MPLTDTKLRSLKPSGKPTKHSDAGGLFVLVTPQGSKLWRLAYRFGGKQKTLSFGSYPIVTLAEARDKRDKAKRLLAETDHKIVAIATLCGYQSVNSFFIAFKKACGIPPGDYRNQAALGRMPQRAIPDA